MHSWLISLSIPQQLDKSKHLVKYDIHLGVSGINRLTLPQAPIKQITLDFVEPNSSTSNVYKKTEKMHIK